MAPPPLWGLLRLAALCHLTALLAGQHLGVKKCNITCNRMTSEIPVALLDHYHRNQESCGKPAIILRTIKNRTFCADPKEIWVQKAIAHLERQTALPIQNGGTFEKQIGVGEPRTTPATRGMDRPAVTEPKSTQENSGQEAQRASGTSSELPTGVADSWGTRFPSTPKAPDGGPPAGSQKTEFFNAATLTTATSWQSSPAYKPGSGLWTEGKASEALPTQAPSTQASPTQAPSTQAPSTQTPSTQAPPTQAPSTQTLATRAPPTHTPTISHRASEDSVGPEGQPVWITGDNPKPENSLGPEEMGPISAHTDTFGGPDGTPHLSMVPVSSQSVPSREPVASGSWTSKAEEPIHATVDPQRLGVVITPVPDSQAATRRQAVGLLAFLGLLFCLGVAMFAYQSLQGCPRKLAGDMVEGLRYVPRSCGSNSYVLVPV
ncbi:fractalkine isoform X1 [Eumetopias jubatus]|uniref:fractalkine isoform X1 n=1 Tax=Eumetopias jubatus TaxID=34886 RepID=UPI001016886F|nr:fractalkine isoform X1 [Eumetopias jubatus]